MRTKNFHTYLKKRLDKKEIAEISKQALLEKQALQKLQDDISKIIYEYMGEQGIGFNELVRRLGVSPSQISKIQKGEANLTIASLAHIFALLKKTPHLTSA
ncbi:MAG: helix-turn-helix domain-containing protein [Gammaproteobacteria bacterium]|nr:helix-turn-helix domain-containing protein [Gammaproteobacteria bacterium]